MDPFSLLAVGYSLVMADLAQGEGSITRSMIGKAVESVVLGPVGNYSYDKLKDIYANFQEDDIENLNHDLQRAARKAQLSATLLAVGACLAETRRLNAHEKAWWSKASGLILKDKDEKWLNEVAALLQKKIDRLSKETPPEIVEQDQIISLFDPKLNIDPADVQKQIVAKLKEDSLAEIRTEGYSVSPIPEAAYECLEEAIKKGWNEFTNDTSDIISLNLHRSLYSPEQQNALINPDRQFDWFSLVCGLFNEEYKNNTRVEAAMQKYLLLDIRDRQTGTQLNPKEVADLLAGHLKQFGDSFARLEELLKTIDAKQDRVLGKQEEILVFVGNQFKDLARRIGEVTQTVIVESDKVKGVVVEKSDEILKHQREMEAAWLKGQSATVERIEEIDRTVKKIITANSQKQRIDLNPVPNPLPSADDVFDRRDECARLKELIEAEDTRLVTILAPSGYGKTKLVAKFLQDIAPRSRLRADAPVNGILFISCRDSSTGKVWSEVFDKAGLMIGKREEFAGIFKKEVREQVSHLFAALNEAGNFWIVLDSFEDLLNKEDLTIGEDGNDPVRNLLHRVFELNVNQRFVITTQRSPAFVGRNAPVLREEHYINVAGTPEADAVRYLREEEGARFMLREVSENILRDFVRRVDCLPLAVVSLIRHLDKYFKRKPKGSVTLAKLEEEIKATGAYIETDKENGLRNWLTEQIIELPVDERLLLSILSLFREPCPKIALAFMLPNFSDDEIDGVLAQLERNRLLYQEGQGFQLSAIIRECVYGLIPETAVNEDDNFNQAALHTRAADFYVSIRKPKEQWKTIEDFKPQFEEMYHCRQAALYDRAANAFDKEDSKFLSRAGYSHRIIEARKELIGKPMLELSAAYNNYILAIAYYYLGDYRTAIKHFNDAREVYKSKDRKQEGIMLGAIGIAYLMLSEYQKALKYYEQAVEIHRQVGNSYEEHRVLGYQHLTLGAMSSNLRAKREALEFYEQALREYREVGDETNVGIVLQHIGNAHFNLGEYREAIKYYEKARDIHSKPEVSDRVAEGVLLGNIGLAKFYLGEKVEGIRLVKQALEIARQVRGEKREAHLLNVLEWMEKYTDDAS